MSAIHFIQNYYFSETLMKLVMLLYDFQSVQFLYVLGNWGFLKVRAENSKEL
jgi:hypothetical protein